MLAAGLIDVINGADIRMIQRGGRPRFALKALDRRRILCQFSRQKLESNQTLELQILGLVDDAHAAVRDPFEDAVARQETPAGHVVVSADAVVYARWDAYSRTRSRLPTRSLASVSESWRSHFRELEPHWRMAQTRGW